MGRIFECLIFTPFFYSSLEYLCGVMAGEKEREKHSNSFRAKEKKFPFVCIRNPIAPFVAVAPVACMNKLNHSSNSFER